MVVNIIQNKNYEELQNNRDLVAEMAMSEAVVEAAQDEIDKDKKKRDRIGESKKKGKSFVSQLISLDGEKSKKAKQDVLESSLMSGLVPFQKKSKELEKKLEKELEKLFKDKAAKEDVVQLSAAVGEIMQEDEEQKIDWSEDIIEEAMLDELEAIDIKKHRKTKKGEEARSRQTLSDQVKTARQMNQQKKGVQQFALAFAGYVHSKNVQDKKQAEQIKQQLYKNGVTTQQINTMETTVGRLIKQQYIFELKKGLLKHFFSFSDKMKTSHVQTKIQYNKLAKDVESTRDAGLLKSGTENVMSNLKVDLRNEIESFLFDEASNYFVEYSLGQKTIDEYSEELMKLQKVASAAGLEIDVNFEERVNKKIEKSIESLGLEEFIPPENESGTFSSEEGDHQDQKQKEPLYINQEELLEDKLRHLYMMKCLDPSLRTKADIFFKMRRLRNGLIKLGVSIEENEDQLQKEGAYLAQIRLIEDLKGAFKEQATLLKLAGPAYTILKKKKTFLVSQLRKLGCKIKYQELKQIRDESNREMAPVIKEQIDQIEVMLEIEENKKIVAIRQRYKLLKEIMARLKKETIIFECKKELGKMMLQHKVQEAV